VTDREKLRRDSRERLGEIEEKLKRDSRERI